MKHAHIVPLVGGSVVGTTQATGVQPEYIASWDAFAKNDAYCLQHFKGVPFHNLDIKMPKVSKVDIMTCVPPCSGLSTATPSTARGCQAPQNEHMLKVAEFGMLKKTDVIIIENAPALYGNGGEEFANRFLIPINKHGYSMMLMKTSTILHGLPQNRVRSFVLLFKGKQIPQLEWIDKPYLPLNKWPVERQSEEFSKWIPSEDEMIQVLMKKAKVSNIKGLIAASALKYNGKPVTGWKLFNDLELSHSFKQKPYKYMWETSQGGNGIMDRSPYLVSDHTNALMWKSVPRMINPSATHRPFNIRELMNLMGLPKSFKEIPAKHINVLFQNVPATTVKTLVQEVMQALDGKRYWYKPSGLITRVNNIKQRIETLKDSD